MTVYRSTLPKRNRPVLRDDFESLRDFRVGAAKLPSDDALDAWNKNIRLMPADFQSLFTENFSEDIRMKVDISRTEFAMKLASKQAGKFQGDFEIYFDETKEMFQPNSKIEVGRQARGQGIGKGWLRAIAEFYAANGERSFPFVAGDETGAYVWARMQVPLDIRTQARESLEGSSRTYLYKLESIRPYLERDHYESAHHLLQMKNADDMIRFTQDERPVPVSVYEALWEQPSDIFRSLLKQHEENPVLRAKPREIALKATQRMSDAFNDAVTAGRNPTLSVVLGRYASWPAVIDFDDAPRMDIIGQKLGGWRTIEPS